MKSIHSNIAKNRTTKQYCVKYHPTDAQEPRPHFKALWHALSAYNRVAVGERTGVSIEAAFRALEKATSAAKAHYPHLGVTVLENGRDMFATHRDAIH